jgi:predicted DNA-binding transcriptional regulator AlpA
LSALCFFDLLCVFIRVRTDHAERETAMPLDVLLTVEETAARLKLSKHTLNRWRVTGEGPPFVKYGPRLVRYGVATLDEWEQSRVRGSTSEYG